ncbi:hypothetical protein [Frigoribacterium sp. RIT-PI-h]|uniref:hypothetical protein n=1 Tax=Frigoribacterium sp. RIT-PI-h TaxID=1690245 RepID=UPI0006B88B02|nr:hypothetical protein [Frigoribacterium sp. RIT-PI-h]
MANTTPRVLHARAYRDTGKWWTIEIPELTQPGPNGSTIVAVGGAVTVKSIASEARDLAAVWLDVDPDEIDVQVTVEVPDEVRQMWDDGVVAEAEARAAVQRAAALRRRAVHQLREQGYTQDAVAAAFKISHQRAQQLAAKDLTPGVQAELSALDSVR